MKDRVPACRTWLCSLHVDLMPRHFGRLPWLLGAHFLGLPGGGRRRHVRETEAPWQRKHLLLHDVPKRKVIGGFQHQSLDPRALMQAERIRRKRLR